MRVDARTRYEGKFQWLEPSLADGERGRLSDAAARSLFGEGGYWSMTVAEFFKVLNGDASVLIRDGGKSVFDVYALKGFDQFVKDFTDAMARLTPARTSQEAMAAASCVKMTFEQSLYVFARAYFGLPSFGMVDDLPLADILLAKTDAYNKAVFDRAMINMASKKKGATQ